MGAQSKATERASACDLHPRAEGTKVRLVEHPPELLGEQLHEGDHERETGQDFETSPLLLAEFAIKQLKSLGGRPVRRASESIDGRSRESFPEPSNEVAHRSETTAETHADCALELCGAPTAP